MSELDEQIRIVLKNYDQFITTKQAISDIKALIANQVREAKLKELEDFRNSWHTMIRQEVHQDLNDRIAQLRSIPNGKE